ncbi:hypothetical protein ABGV49_19475 [Chromobacterium vaccinii]|uniref:Uncharacterized protein n=1 Tax=Chromobacterium vaccinii TaxID=1108595 RepID=A0ABV0FGM7_9NEIS
MPHRHAAPGAQRFAGHVWWFAMGSFYTMRDEEKACHPRMRSCGFSWLNIAGIEHIALPRRHTKRIMHVKTAYIAVCKNRQGKTVLRLAPATALTS